jgi:hypothetical protein
MPRRLAIWVPALAFVLMSLLALAASCDGNGGEEASPKPKFDGQAGGGGPPPPELVAELELLPLYPGTEPIDPVHPEGSSTGTELETGYWARGTIEEVMAFYDDRLPEDWEPERLWERSTYEKGDLKTEQAQRSFAKDGLRLTLTVGTSEKDPKRGNLIIRVLIVPRDSTFVPEKAGFLALRLETGDNLTVRWQDHLDETGYRVSGSAIYWPRCEEATANAIQELEFNEKLPADVSEFILPQPNGADFVLKELVVDLFAFASDGSEMLRDGLSFTVEPPGWPDHPLDCD